MQKVWEAVRPLYLLQGVDNLVGDMDILVANEDRFLNAPDTFQDEFTSLANSLRNTLFLNNVNATAVLTVASLKQSVDEWRKLENERLQPPRGKMYVEFLRDAQLHTKDRYFQHTLLKSPLPKVGQMWGREFRELDSKLAEQRMRQLANATSKIVETYYKPLLSIVWHLMAQMVGSQKKCPRMCGNFFEGCERMWTQNPTKPSLFDFIDNEAVAVRNGIAHPEKTWFVPSDKTLILGRGAENEISLNEDELESRLYALLDRCLTMSTALRCFTAKPEG